VAVTRPQASSAEWGLLPAPLLDLSAYLEPRRDRYYDGLLKVSTQGDWTGWLLFFLEVVEEQARDALQRAARSLQDLCERMRRQVSAVRSSGSAAKLVDALFDIPVITISRAQLVLDMTHRAASLNIAKLVDLGILTEIHHERRRRLFIASEVMAAVERSDQ